GFITVTAQTHTAPATSPMASAGPGSTNPAAGVMATRPATAPEIAPSTDGLPRRNHSAKLQDSVAPAAATCVTSTAMPARALAPIAPPELKPIHPIHSKEAPMTA